MQRVAYANFQMWLQVARYWEHLVANKTQGWVFNVLNVRLITYGTQTADSCVVAHTATYERHELGS